MIDVARFKRLADAAADGLKERSEIVAGALLAVLSGQSVFFYGPPGRRRVSSHVGSRVVSSHRCFLSV